MNELILIENIEKRLKQRREPVIFPLASNHRKELRDLKSKNVGNLRDRLSTIKKLKLEEFKKKYYGEISSKLTKYSVNVKNLNIDWDMRLQSIKKIIDERIALEKKFDMKYINYECGYSNVAKLGFDVDEDNRRKFIFNADSVVSKIAEDMFKEKYSVSFEEVSKRIDDVCTKYEEAINFGDLEIVKELYYIMKSADKFFEKVADLKV